MKISYAITSEKKMYFGNAFNLEEMLDGESYLIADSVEELLKTLISDYIHCSDGEPLDPDDPCCGVDASWYMMAAHYLMDLCNIDVNVTFEEL